MDILQLAADTPTATARTRTPSPTARHVPTSHETWTEAVRRKRPVCARPTPPTLTTKTRIPSPAASHVPKESIVICSVGANEVEVVEVVVGLTFHATDVR